MMLSQTQKPRRPIRIKTAERERQKQVSERKKEGLNIETNWCKVGGCVCGRVHASLYKQQ